MSHDLDTRARRAATNLKATVAGAELRSIPPGRPRRRLAAALRPAWVAAVLLLGSTVGLALVIESTPTAPTVPPTTTATTVATTTTRAPEPTSPTTAVVVPVAPPSAVTIPDVEAPYLAISSPENGAELAEPRVTVVGITEPGARVFLDGEEIEVDASGGWQTVFTLREGANLGVFTARDGAGNRSEVSLTVYYYAPTTTTTTPEETTTTVEELAEFSAFATFGSCSVTPPYDVYYGTGEPGSLIQVSSEHGSGVVEVGEAGEWEVKVLFPTAPPGVAFPVKVSDEYGRKAVFEFVYTP